MHLYISSCGFALMYFKAFSELLNLKSLNTLSLDKLDWH